MSTIVEISASEISGDSHPARVAEAVGQALGIDPDSVGASVFRESDGSLKKVVVEVGGLFDRSVITRAITQLVVAAEDSEIAEGRAKEEADAPYIAERLIAKIKNLEQRVAALELRK